MLGLWRSKLMVYKTRTAHNRKITTCTAHMTSLHILEVVQVQVQTSSSCLSESQVHTTANTKVSDFQSYIVSDIITEPEDFHLSMTVYSIVFLCMPTTSWLHLTLIIVPHHLCFMSVRMMLTGDTASCHHWSGTTHMSHIVSQGMLTGYKTLPKQTNHVNSCLDS